MELIFVYDIRKGHSGSVKMRGMDIASKIGAKIAPIDMSIANSRVICLKMKDYSSLIPLTLNNEVIIDMVDFEFPERKFRKEVFRNFDYGIFSCKRQLELYADGFKFPEKCRVIYHHWDERLRDTVVPSMPTLNIGYFGAPNKCNLPNGFKDITYHYTPLSTQSHFQSVLPFYVQHNAHYIIKRRSQEEASGSLLKLSNASAIGCPVITVKKGYDELLTDDYPFYSESHDAMDIQRVINDMKKGYLGDSWNLALKILGLVKEKTDINEICKLYP